MRLLLQKPPSMKYDGLSEDEGFTVFLLAQ
jgi:hypothetical protein